jgi:predicted AAA+ superfamily ATPase
MLFGVYIRKIWYICDVIQRTLSNTLRERWTDSKALIVYGPRQVGKTTLIREMTKNEDFIWLSGDEADVRNMLESPNSVSLKNIIGSRKFLIIDEAQRIENIGLVIKVVVDQIPNVKVIASGSSSFELSNKVNEVLTGRKWDYMLFPFSFEEMVNEHGLLEEKRMLEHRLIYGYYPEIVTSPDSPDLRLKLLAESYLYKDLLAFEQIRKPDKLEKLLQALALQVGSEVSNNELGQICGLDKETVERYLDLLEKTFVIFRVPSFSRNLRNELKKSRKIYFVDNGMRNAIINQFTPFRSRSDQGALWENFVMSERRKLHSYRQDRSIMYFWRTTEQQEVDLVETKDGEIKAFEITWSSLKKKKLTKTFSNSYPVSTFDVIHQDSFDRFVIPD